MAAANSAHNSWFMNSCWGHASGKANAMGSSGTSEGVILLKELLGHGLATHNEHDSAVLGNLDSLPGVFSPKLAKHGHHSLCCQMKCLKWPLYLGDWVAFSVYSFYFSSNTLPLLQIYIDKLRGESLGLRSPKTSVPKPRIEDCFFWRLCVSVKQWQCRGLRLLTVSLDVCTSLQLNISETRSDGSSQVWSQLMMHEQLLKPLVGKSTCYGLLWHSCGCHSLEGVAWSRPGYPRWTW